MLANKHALIPSAAVMKDHLDYSLSCVVDFMQIFLVSLCYSAQHVFVVFLSMFLLKTAYSWRVTEDCRHVNIWLCKGRQLIVVQ